MKPAQNVYGGVETETETETPTTSSTTQKTQQQHKKKKHVVSGCAVEFFIICLFFRKIVTQSINTC
jgi:hypothetical protein